MPEISEDLYHIREQIAVLRTIGENTLLECRKTNGRVTKLEDSHSNMKSDVAVLKDNMSKVVPEVEKKKNFIATLKGNWVGITSTIAIIILIMEKFHILFK